MQRDTERMNLPQPGTIKTKGRKEQTSELKTSRKAARPAPPVQELISHTLVCTVRALMEARYSFIAKSPEDLPL